MRRLPRPVPRPATPLQRALELWAQALASASSDERTFAEFAAIVTASVARLNAQLLDREERP